MVYINAIAVDSVFSWKCTEYHLAITNTVFRLLNKHKTKWIHPRSKQWRLIDYTTVRQDVELTIALFARIWTCIVFCTEDHRKQDAPANLISTSWKPIMWRNNFPQKHLARTSFASVNVDWKHFRDILLTVTTNTLGSQTKTPRFWRKWWEKSSPSQKKNIPCALLGSTMPHPHWKNQPTSTPGISYNPNFEQCAMHGELIELPRVCWQEGLQKALHLFEMHIWTPGIWLFTRIR